jgi:hypothetical protein
MSQVHFDPDLSLEFFMLEPTAAEDAEPTGSSTAKDTTGASG